MTEKDIEEYIYKKYKVMAEEDLVKQGVVKKITKAVTKILKYDKTTISFLLPLHLRHIAGLPL